MPLEPFGSFDGCVEYRLRQIDAWRNEHHSFHAPMDSLSFTLWSNR